jgi:transposase-like protein
MGTGELNRVVRAIQEMSWSQRRVLMQRLKAAQAGDQARAIVEDRLQALRACPHCHGMHVVRNGTTRGLQRHRCRGCGRTFNALTHTPLARLRYRERWLDHSQALIDGLSITKAALRLEVARSTAFRWRHRFLALPHQVKASLQVFLLGEAAAAGRRVAAEPAAGRPAGPRPSPGARARRLRACRASRGTPSQL